MVSERHLIKVDEKITPIHYAKRTEPILNVGEEYYVCFGNNLVYPCILNEVIVGPPKRVVISKYDSGKFFGQHVLFSNEIGETPEKAVINTVSF